jgi:hypothetical protein
MNEVKKKKISKFSRVLNPAIAGGKCNEKRIFLFLNVARPNFGLVDIFSGK